MINIDDKNDEPEQIELGSELDLHHFHPKDTKAVINEFIRQASENRLPRIRVVHGKGKSVKKQLIYKILKTHPDVLSFRDDGYNWGATVIELRSGC